ncbi:MAG: Holliday junction branch migration DNA helicase RuvB [Candidatus Paceibacterota bacterium]|jgi:Holliday junction DNA helicase RuvB|nr:Holliday junction branch migration DNA helicase RuvB [Candidatus Paceibacterota bacterium]MDD4830837.1 Holliday junction branch migration DNA helicase RuvB [Candidatus Paceibacterota bacterium]MDD4874918.1 Holliday junction branch migration DNA helicase RuvB [Candidatus Paceibacterota bacterium]
MSVKNKTIEEGPDEKIDSTLRPQAWGDYIGQEKIKRNVKIIIDAAKKRKEAPDHLLFYGNAGLGKTSLAYLIAKELGSDIRVTSGPAIERIGDLAALLTSLSEGDVIFIDEIHRICKTIEEYLYSAIEDFKMNIVMGKGPMAKTLEIDLPKFTLIGATTRAGLLSSPLHSRFGGVYQLNFYKQEELERILQRSADILGIKIKSEALSFLARSSRFTPRIANNLLKRVRDFAEIEGEGIVTEKIVKSSLSFLEIDEKGLGPSDRNLLEIMIKKFQGGPVGIKSLAAAAAEEEETILNLYEPYLMQLGMIERTSQGRIAAKSAYNHLKIKWEKDSQSYLI